MSNQLTFQEAKETHFKRLNQFVPIVARVHGGSHPEFHEVKKVYDEIIIKTNESELVKPQLDREFTKLREITSHYKVPGDVCESYEAVYQMLSEVDQAYHA